MSLRLNLFQHQNKKCLWKHIFHTTKVKSFLWNKRPLLACTCICRSMFFASLDFFVGSCTNVSDVLLTILVFLFFEFVDHFVCCLVTSRSNNGRRERISGYRLSPPRRDKRQPEIRLRSRRRIVSFAAFDGLPCVYCYHSLRCSQTCPKILDIVLY